MKLIRHDFRPDGIFGILYDAEGDQIACTLEHSYADRPKLPVGTYVCIRGQHRLHDMTQDFDTFEITGVPGHTNILFHWGNYNRDSEGCVLLGRGVTDSPVGWMVTSSRATFARFMLDLEGIDSFQLTVEDGVVV